jgi:hypothetical protein
LTHSTRNGLWLGYRLPLCNACPRHRATERTTVLLQTLAPEAGIEPATVALTVRCSAAELLWTCCGNKRPRGKIDQNDEPENLHHANWVGSALAYYPTLLTPLKLVGPHGIEPGQEIRENAPGANTSQCCGNKRYDERKCSNQLSYILSDDGTRTRDLSLSRRSMSYLQHAQGCLLGKPVKAGDPSCYRVEGTSISQAPRVVSIHAGLKGGATVRSTGLLAGRGYHSSQRRCPIKLCCVRVMFRVVENDGMRIEILLNRPRHHFPKYSSPNDPTSTMQQIRL